MKNKKSLKRNVLFYAGLSTVIATLIAFIAYTVEFDTLLGKALCVMVVTLTSWSTFAVIENR